MASLSRREFLKLAGATTVAAATAAAIGLRPAESSPAASLEAPTEKVELVPSICRMCTATCSILVRVRNGVPEKIEGNPEAWPLNEGRICARGNMGILRTRNPDRLLKPLIRATGPRGKWGFREASWDEAVKTVAEKLGALVEAKQGWKLITVLGEIGCATYHPHVVAFNKTIGSPNIVSLPLSTCIMPKGMAWGVTGLAGRHVDIVPDYKRTRYYLSFGRNLGGAIAVGQTAKAGDKLREYKLVVLDPRLSEWASKADEWIPIRPGTDLAFLLAMINVVINERLYDEEYLAKYTNAPMVIEERGLAPVKTRKIKKSIAGNEVELVDYLVYDRVRGGYTWASEAIEPSLEIPEEKRVYEGKRVRTVFEALADHVKDYTPEWASRITGVPAETIRRIAREYASTKPAAIETGWNTNKWWNAFQTYRAAAVLAALTGNLLRPGGVVLSTAGIGMVLKRATPPVASEKSVLLQAEKELEITLHDGTKVKGPLLPLGHGYIGVEDKLAKEKGWVIMVVGGNPARTFMGAVFQRLASLKTVDLVVDLGYYPDDTVLYSDVVLPECAYTERSYTITGTPFTTAKMLRTAFPAHPPPPGAQCKNMIETLVDILAAIDPALVDKYAEHLAEELGVPKCAEKFREALHRYLETRGYDDATRAIQEAQAECMGVDLAALRKKGVVVAAGEEWGLEMNKKILENGWLNSPTGKIEILPLKILGLMKKRGRSPKPEWHPFPTWVPPRWMWKKLARDEFVVVTGKVPTMSYTATVDNPVLSLKLTDRANESIWIHPARAAELGVRDGDWVEVCGEQGECYKARVMVTEMIVPEAVYIPPHYGKEKETPLRFTKETVPPYNKLMKPAVEPVAGAALMSDFTVRIRPAGGEAGR